MLASLRVDALLLGATRQTLRCRSVSRSRRCFRNVRV